MPQTLTSIVKMGDYILNHATLSKVLVPVAQQFVKYGGYRQLGLKFDDLLSEENPVMQTALKRLPSDESYARNFRIIRAHQTELTHHLLPKNEWTKPEDDVPYLLPYALEVEAAVEEKEALDNLEVSK